jgi:hypothetical protein
VALLARAPHEAGLVMGLRLQLLRGFLNRGEDERLFGLGTPILKATSELQDDAVRAAV